MVVSKLYHFGENEIQLGIEHIPIFKSYDELESLEYKQLITDITGEFFTIYGDLIDKISTRTKAIKKDELQKYLYILHFILLEITQRIYESNGLMKERKHFIEIDKNKIENMVKSIDAIEELIKEYGVEKVNKFHQSNKAWFDRLILELSCITKIDKNTPNKHFILNFHTYYLEAIKKLTYPKVYIASFLENPHNSSVWGNYGVNHTGVCQIFEADDNQQLIFLNIKQGENSKGAIIGKSSLIFNKVDYESKFEEINFFESFGLLTESKIISNWYLGETEDEDSILYNKVFENIEKWREEHWKKYHKNKLIKTKDWNYEQEYRITYNALQDYEIEERYRKLKYDFNSLKGLIFGIKTPLENKCKIIEIIKKKCKKNDRNSFEFYQAYYCDTTKDIQYRDLNIKF